MDKSKNKDTINKLIDELLKSTHEELKPKYDSSILFQEIDGINKNERKKYLSIYDECLKKKYFNPSLGSLNNLLYIIINDFEKSLRLERFLFDDMIDYFENKRINTIRELIDLFTRIINDKKDDQIYNQVYNSYQLLLVLSGHGYPDDFEVNVGIYLKAFFYPEEVYAEKNYDFHRLMDRIIFKYVYRNYFYNNNNFDKSKFNILDSRLIRILDMYKEYCDGIKKCCEDFNDRNLFCTRMDKVIAQFYIDKYDISLFPKVLDFVFNNVEQLEAFCKFNNFPHEMKEDEYYMRLIIDACTKDIPVIK